MSKIDMKEGTEVYNRLCILQLQKERISIHSRFVVYKRQKNNRVINKYAICRIHFLASLYQDHGNTQLNKK